MLSARLYVGNLPYEVTENEIRSEFSRFGDVVEVKIVSDHETQRPRGFAFVTMNSEGSAAKAIEELNQQNFGGRTLVVSVAKERERGGSGGGQRRGGRAGRYDRAWQD